MAVTVEMRTQVTQNYVALFGRAPDSDGLGYWVQQMDGGTSIQQIAIDMFNTAPARSYYPEWMTNEELVASFYTNVLGRAPDAEGLAYWTGRLNATDGGTTIREMIDAVVNYAGTDEAALDSQALFNNKVAVGQQYAEQGGGIAMADDVLTGVTADTDTSSPEAIQAVIDSALGPVIGQTFTLTTSLDTVVGTAGDDVIKGIYGGLLGDTATAGDDVDGGAGIDTVELYAQGTGASPAAFNVTNVEKIVIQDQIGATFNALSVQNAPSISFIGTQANLNSKVTNAAIGSMIGISGAGNLAVDFAATGGTADTAHVSLASAGTSTSARSTVDVSDGNSIEGVAIHATGANFVTLNAGTGAKTVALAGDGTNNINLASVASTVTVDASTSTGTNTIGMGTGLSNGDVFKGGTGADTVGFNAVAALGTVTFIDVETLSADFDADLSLNLGNSTGVKTLTMSGSSGSASVTNAKSDLATVNIQSVAVANTDFSLTYATGQAGELSVNLGSTAATAANIAMDDITLTRVSSLALKAIGTKDNSIDFVDLVSSPDVALSMAAGADGYLYVDYIEAASFDDISVTAGESGYAAAGYVYASAGGVGNVTVTAAADGSASLYNLDVSGGGIGDITMAVGSGASGYVDAETYDGEDNGEANDIGDVSMTVASGGDAYVSAYTASGDVGDVNLTVESDGDGWIDVYASAYSGDAGDDTAGGGSIGNINVDVTGDDAWGGVSVSAWNDWSGAAGSIGDIDLNVDGDGADGYVYASGASGGDVGDVTISADSSGYAYVYINSDEYESAGGNVGNATITVGHESDAYLRVYASGSVGTTTVEGGADSDVGLDLEGYRGDVGAVTAEMGDDSYFSGYFSAGMTVGAVTVATGEDSYVYIYADGDDENGPIGVTAGQDSDVYVYADGDVNGAITIAGADGDYAQVYAWGDMVGTVDLSGWGGYSYIDLAGVTEGVVILTGADGSWTRSTNGADSITGGAGADEIWGSGGADVINGGGDADTIFGGLGADVLNGDAGNDIIWGGAGNDVIEGGAGNDTIYGDAGADVIIGGTGVDVLTGGTEADVFVFSNGHSGITAATADSIADFLSATDKLKLGLAGDATALTGNFVEAGAAAADFASALAAANAALTTLNATSSAAQLYAFQFVGADGWLFIDNDSNGGADQVVKLTGVIDIAAADIIA